MDPRISSVVRVLIGSKLSLDMVGDHFVMANSEVDAMNQPIVRLLRWNTERIRQRSISWESPLGRMRTPHFDKDSAFRRLDSWLSPS